MGEFWVGSLVSTVVLAAVTAILIAVGVYVIGRVRQQSTQPLQGASEWMTNFEELHAKGELTDQEYRTIKAVLTERFQDELKETGEPG